MPENDLLKRIQNQLANPAQNLAALFCETLLWGRAQAPAFRREVTIRAGESISLEFKPLAQASGLPVFQVNWPFDKPPTVLQRRSVHRALSSSYVEHLLAYLTRDGRQVSFVWARRRGPATGRGEETGEPADRSRVEMRTLSYSVGSPARTTIEQLGKLAFSVEEIGLFGDPGYSAVIDKLDAAFDVEKVTRAFFAAYRAIFEEAEQSITLPWSAEQKRLYTQRFFNRLMFIAFLERKGWLKFNGRTDYLRALFEDYQRNDPDKRRSANFHRKRLDALFFNGLNNERGRAVQPADSEFSLIRSLIGEVPFLNGGLFERERDEEERAERWFFPDAIIARILSDLFYRFNFTVTESTPLDVEVAVDPEMLGRIFEELVTGRHESGSYYTPKPIVQFMCREALKGYLVGQNGILPETPETIARFVDQNDASTLRDPEAVLAALRQVKVCDPACGSGAYLLGMLHELLELRECLFTARHLDPRTLYERKLEIIQNNLYGVDKDPFAVNIARLRLWLSLIVDYEGETPPPLPNLDFKIEAGDSLTAPDPSGGLQPDLFRYGQVQEFLRLKNEFMSVHAGSEEKAKLKQQIDNLKEKIKEWARVGQVADLSPDSFDWQVEFAEVFAPSLTPGHSLTGRGEPPPPPGGEQEGGQPGGFDIVLANPPYVRQELIKDLKPALKRVYGGLFTGTADLYVYFYLRAHQLLRPGGVACFISSNKWLRAGYGETLRQHLLDEQAFTLVVDFGELPVFQTAATFPAIFVWKKEKRGATPTKWAVVKDLQACYDEGIVAHVNRIAQNVPAAQFGKGKPRLAASSAADLRRQMEARGIPLGEYVQGKIYRGIVTGFNEAFLLDDAARARLMEQDPKSAEIIKPLLVGDDVRRYEIHYRGRYIIFARRGIEINNYPAVLQHLQQYRDKLEPKPATWDDAKQGKWAGRKPGAYAWYELQDTIDYYPAFEQPKIIYPEIARESRFYLDNDKIFPLKTVFSIGLEDWYLLAILNSMLGWEYLKQVCNVLGDENQGGRLTLQAIYVEKLPIPNASQSEREAIASLARQAQALHMQRRARVEQFLRELGIDPARSSSRSPLEKPWLLDVPQVAELRGASQRRAREETLALTDQIVRLEAEIDERVRALYELQKASHLENLCSN